MKIELNLNHLVEQTKNRYDELKNLKDESIKNYFYDLKNLLIKNVPDDWRFTVSPTARFLIYDYWFEGLPDDFFIIILGRTYRDFEDNGKELIEEIENFFNFENSFIPISDKINGWINEYLEIVSNPDAEITHELKTVYGRNAAVIKEEISIIKGYQSIFPEYTPLHDIILKARRISSRPNAIITKEGEIWVRQGEYLNLKENENYEYLHFEKLTKNGVDHSYVRFYKFYEDSKRNLHLKYYSEKKNTTSYITGN